MFLKFLFLFSILCFLNVCSDSPGGAGILMPQKGDGITLVTARESNDTAQLNFNGVIINISGGWVNRSPQNLDIQINNKSSSAMQFDYGKVEFTGENGESFGLDSAVDTTGVNLADDNPNNDEAKQSYSKDFKQKTEMTINVPPGEQRKVILIFSISAKPKDRLTEGKTVTMPLPNSEIGEERSIIFKCD
ncbi:MAG: hypothetical protein ACR2GD_12075 [Pyrinomonadaceae bacterium]